MPQIRQLTQKLDNYQSTSWTSDHIFLSDIQSTTLTFLCNNSCSVTFYHSIDEQYQVIYQESYTLIANSVMDFINIPVKTRYFQVEITGITVGSNLVIQAFYHV